MQKLSFKLEIFEGPMDLLLNLISKHKLNIYDIEISSLLDQYLLYLNQCREHDLELAGEFLEMAARLIYIKTSALLPRPEEAEKEKQELQGALIEYARCQQASKILSSLWIGDKIFTRKQMKISVPLTYSNKHEASELTTAFLNIGQKLLKTEVQPQKTLKRVVNRPVVSVISKIVHLLRTLRKNEHVYLDALYLDTKERSARVALFLAILELTKHGTIKLSDDNTYVYLKPTKNQYEESEQEEVMI